MPQLRLAPSGFPFEGNAPGDILEWDGTEWQLVPGGGGGVLAGDANGPVAANEVNSVSPVVGGPNIPLDDFTSDPADPRIVVRAAAGGPITTVTLGSLGFVGAFDFVITSLADLQAVAPLVGSTYELPNGSYAIKNSFSLPAGENIAAPVGSFIFLQSMGDNKTISGDVDGPTLDIRTGARVHLVGTQVNNGNAGANCTAVRSAGQEVRSWGVSFSGNGGTGRGVEMTAGDWTDTAGEMRGGGREGMVQSGGVFRAQGTQFSSAGADAYSQTSGTFTASLCDFDASLGASALNVTSGDATRTELASCELFSDTANCIEFGAADGDLDLANCHVNCQLANGSCVNLTAASTVQIQGGTLESDPAARGNGVRIDGNIQGGLIMTGVHGEALGTGGVPTEAFVTYVSGTVRRATLHSCDTATDVSTAVNWAAASIPTNGLSIVGCNWDDPTPYNGFTHTSARVNCKANTQQSALMSETPIVP